MANPRLPVPQAAKGEMLIRVPASAISNTDIMPASAGMRRACARAPSTAVAPPGPRRALHGQPRRGKSPVTGPGFTDLRRVLIDKHGNPKGELSRGEQKSLQTDRVILVLGPEQEQDVVPRMYRMFVEDGRSEREIADVLNADGLRTDLERPWTRATVHQVLTTRNTSATTSSTRFPSS